MATNLAKAHKALFLNTLAFTICFACWTLNGVLVTFLVEKGIFDWSVVEIGWLMGIPILTGAVMRLPLGILTDKFGGKKVFSGLLFVCAIPLLLMPFATSFLLFAILSFFFGLVGASFAVGVAYTAVWYPKEWQGRALGIFGVGNAGAAITAFLAPTLLNYFSESDPLNGWKMLPVIYGVSLLILGAVFLIFAEEKKVEGTSRSLKGMMQPLKSVRVWRFGTYYFLVFGCFVAYSQWLLPNFMNVYQTTLVMGGMFAALFSLPSGVIRAFGGYLSDKYGARKVMYWVLGTSTAFSFLLMIPKMDVYTKGKGIMAAKAGTITEITTDKITIGEKEYPVNAKGENSEKEVEGYGDILPSSTSWQEIVVNQNDVVKKKELLAKGITRIHFDANMWVYLVLVVLIGMSWGIGKAAVYKHIPEYFPNEVGVVGGMVGLLGGLGGFFCPIIFSYLLTSTGLWTSSWLFIFLFSGICLLWMNNVITKMGQKREPELSKEIDWKE